MDEKSKVNFEYLKTFHTYMSLNALLKRSFSYEMNMSCVLHMYYACNKFYGSTLMQELYNYHSKQFLLV